MKLSRTHQERMKVMRRYSHETLAHYLAGAVIFVDTRLLDRVELLLMTERQEKLEPTLKALHAKIASHKWAAPASGGKLRLVAYTAPAQAAWRKLIRVDREYARLSMKGAEIAKRIAAAAPIVPSQPRASKRDSARALAASIGAD